MGLKERLNGSRSLAVISTPVNVMLADHDDEGEELTAQVIDSHGNIPFCPQAAQGDGLHVVLHRVVPSSKQLGHACSEKGTVGCKNLVMLLCNYAHVHLLPHLYTDR